MQDEYISTLSVLSAGVFADYLEGGVLLIEHVVSGPGGQDLGTCSVVDLAGGADYHHLVAIGIECLIALVKHPKTLSVGVEDGHSLVDRILPNII